MQNPLPLQIDGFVFDSKNLKIQLLGDVSEMEDSGNEFLMNQENLVKLGLTVAESFIQELSKENPELSQEYVFDGGNLSAENDLIPALRLYTELNHGVFPEELFAPMRDPSSESGIPIDHLGVILRAFRFIQKNKNNDFHLEMGGVRYGSPEPICWWRPEGTHTYKVIYGDLSVADVSPDDFVQEN